MGVEGFFAELFRESMHNRYIQFIPKEYDGKMEQKQQCSRLSGEICDRNEYENGDSERLIHNQQSDFRADEGKDIQGLREKL